MRPVAVAKRPKKDRNFHASNWLFAQTTHVHIGLRGSQFKFPVSNPQKALPWPERRMMTYCAWGVSTDATCGRGEETKKGQKLSCVKLAICPDHPRPHRPLKFCMRGRVREVVIYFKWSMGLRAVEGRNPPFPINKAHGLYKSLYYRTSRDICDLRSRFNFPLRSFSLRWLHFH